MNNDIFDSIASKMRKWEYNDDDIKEATDIFENYSESNGEILDYIITDASESAPNRFDDYALDVICLTKTNVFFVLYDGEISKYSSRSIDDFRGVEIETTSQRIELSIMHSEGRFAAASYSKESFEEIRDFGLIIDSKVRE